MLERKVADISGQLSLSPHSFSLLSSCFEKLPHDFFLPTGDCKFIGIPSIDELPSILFHTRHSSPGYSTCSRDWRKPGTWMSYPDQKRPGLTERIEDRLRVSLGRALQEALWRLSHLTQVVHATPLGLRRDLAGCGRWRWHAGGCVGSSWRPRHRSSTNLSARILITGPQLRHNVAPQFFTTRAGGGRSSILYACGFSEGARLEAH